MANIIIQNNFGKIIITKPFIIRFIDSLLSIYSNIKIEKFDFQFDKNDSKYTLLIDFYSKKKLSVSKANEINKYINDSFVLNLKVTNCIVSTQFN